MLHSLRDILTAILDAVLPPRERTVRLRNARELAGAPQSQTLLGSRITTLIPYHVPGVEDAIRALKYDGNAKAARLLAALLEDYLREEIASMRAFSPRPIILVPIPLHTRRQRERGFNQIVKVLSQLPAEFRDGTLSRIEPRALFRVRHTPQQTRLSRAERLANIRGAFSADERTVRGTHVILVDDVCTTGATLSEGAKTLTKAGGKVATFALARA
jgi:ComF family protein